MRFYNRKSEIAALKEIEARAKKNAQMTVVMGRRRVGKTAILKQAFTATPVLYFFIERKTESLLCEEFIQQIEHVLNINVFGEIKTFKSLFAFLMKQSETKRFTLILDEFQELNKVNEAIFSEMQNVWDSGKNNSKINLVICGSIYSMMKRIFENYKEPLYGRATSKLFIDTFNISTIKEILAENNSKYKNEDLLSFFMLTGGIAKYTEQLVDISALSKNAMFDSIFTAGSFFLSEGKDVLVDEFGKDYGTYFSILSLIASSKTDRSSIESILGFDTGGFLTRLEDEYGIIKRKRPFGAKEGSRSNKYIIEDCFLNFWFRFIYKYRSAVEIGNLEYVKDIVKRDYETYSGIILEKYFKEKLKESKKFSDIQSYWDRKGENEIDIIAVNDIKKIINFYEVKRNKKRINLDSLKKKSQNILANYPDYKASFIPLSMEDM